VCIIPRRRHAVEHTTEDAQFSIDIALPQEHIAMEVRLFS
jgi:hypothetical protein